MELSGLNSRISSRLSEVSSRGNASMQAKIDAAKNPNVDFQGAFSNLMKSTSLSNVTLDSNPLGFKVGFEPLSSTYFRPHDSWSLSSGETVNSTMCGKFSDDYTLNQSAFLQRSFDNDKISARSTSLSRSDNSSQHSSGKANKTQPKKGVFQPHDSSTNADTIVNPFESVPTDGYLDAMFSKCGLSDFDNGDAQKQIDQDEEEFLKEKQFELGDATLQNASLISNFSHVQTSPNADGLHPGERLSKGQLFRTKSEPLGDLYCKNKQRPDFGLAVDSPKGPKSDDDDVFETINDVSPLSRLSSKPQDHTETSTFKMQSKYQSTGSLPLSAAGERGIQLWQRSQSANEDTACPSIEGGYPSYKHMNYNPSVEHLYPPMPYNCNPYTPYQPPPFVTPSYGPPPGANCRQCPASSMQDNYFMQQCKGNYQDPSANAPLCGPPEISGGVTCIGIVEEILFQIMNPSSRVISCSISSVAVNGSDSTLKELGFDLPEPFLIPPKTPKQITIPFTAKKAGLIDAWLEVCSRVPIEKTLIGSFVTHLYVKCEEPNIKVVAVTDAGEYSGNCVQFGEVPVYNRNDSTRFCQLNNEGAAAVPLMVFLNTITSCNCEFIIPYQQLNQLNSQLSQKVNLVTASTAMCKVSGRSSNVLPITIGTRPGKICNRGDCLVKGELVVKLKWEKSTTEFGNIPLEAHVVHRETNSRYNEQRVPSASNQMVPKQDLETPRIRISRKNLFFPGVEVGQNSQQKLILLNGGENVPVSAKIKLDCANDSFSLIEDENGLYIRTNLLRCNLQPKIQKSVNLIFTPRKDESYSAEITIETSTSKGKKKLSPVKVYGYGGVSRLQISRPAIESDTATLDFSYKSEAKVYLRNSGSRASFGIIVIPNEDKMKEVGLQISPSRGFIVQPKSELDLEIQLSQTGLDLSKTIHLFVGDEQLRKTCSRFQINLELPFNLKTSQLFKKLDGEKNVPKCDLYPESNEVVDIFHQNITKFDLKLVSKPIDESFYTASEYTSNTLNFEGSFEWSKIGMSPSIKELKDVSVAKTTEFQWDVQPRAIQFNKVNEERKLTIRNINSLAKWFKIQTPIGLKINPEFGMLSDQTTIAVKLMSRAGPNNIEIIEVNCGQEQLSVKAMIRNMPSISSPSAIF